MCSSKRSSLRPLLGALLTFSIALPAPAQQPPKDLAPLSLEQLLDIKVTTASKSAERLSDAPGVVAVITQDELKRFGGTTLKDLLARVPSLIGSSVYMTDRSTIAVRGDQVQPSSSHVLFLLNGRPVREVLEGGIKSELYETLPLDAIERIEVIKGPGSVLYGSNAFSGVINVITKKADATSLSLTGFGGEAGAYGGSGAAMIKAGDLQIFASGAYRKKAEWDTQYVMTDPTTQKPVANAITVPDKGPGAFLDVSYKNLRLMSAFNAWDNAYFIPDFQAMGGAHWEKRFADLGYGWQVKPTWKMDFNVTYTRSRFEVTSFPNIKRDSYEALAEWTNFFTPNSKVKITVGGLYGRVDGGETYYGLGFPIPISDGRRSNFAGYGQVDYLIHPKLSVIGGVQANKVEQVPAGVVPRGGLIWRPAERVSVKALYGQAFRSPSINELLLNHPGLKGNPNLKPEKVGTVDVSIGYQGEHTQASVSYFVSDQTQIIYQNRTGAIPVYDNLGEAKFRGFEVEAKHYVGKQVYLTGSVSHQRSEDGTGVQDITPIAGFGAKAGLSYQSERGINVSLFDVYQGDLDSKYDTKVNPSPGSYNLLNLHGSVALNKLLGLKLGQELKLFVQADNLLDKEVWLPAWGLLPGNSIPYIQGRAVYAGLTLGVK